MSAGPWLYAIGKGIEFGGKVYSGMAEANALKAQAMQQEREAAEVRRRNVYDTIRGNEETRRLLSTQRAIFGQAGVTLEGAPTNLMLQTKQERVLERIEHATAARAQVENLWENADALRRAARDVRVAAYYGAIGQGLQGVGSGMMGGK